MAKHIYTAYGEVCVADTLDGAKAKLGCGAAWDITETLKYLALRELGPEAFGGVSDGEMQLQAKALGLRRELEEYHTQLGRSCEAVEFQIIRAEAAEKELATAKQLIAMFEEEAAERSAREEAADEQAMKDAEAFGRLGIDIETGKWPAIEYGEPVIVGFDVGTEPPSMVVFPASVVAGLVAPSVVDAAETALAAPPPCHTGGSCG